MPILTKSGSLAVVTGLLSFAANPVARVISMQPIAVDGITGPARSFMPLSAGDEVETDSVAATIQFADGTTVTLQPHSKLRIEVQASGPVARVVQGAAVYDVARSGQGASYTHLPATSATQPAANRDGVHSTPKRPSTLLTKFRGLQTANGTLTSGTNGAQIVMANGVTINLTSTVDPITGTTTLVVSSIQQNVSTPGGGSVVVTATSGVLIGATVTVNNTTITFTAAGSSTSMTPVQVATAIQTALQQAVGSGTSSGSLPSGTRTPSPSPVSTGQFSPSGS